MKTAWSMSFVLGMAAGYAALQLITGAWSVYSHEYAHVGIKFAPELSPGCGVEIPTAEGRELGVGLTYCYE